MMQRLIYAIGLLPAVLVCGHAVAAWDGTVARAKGEALLLEGMPAAGGLVTPVSHGESELAEEHVPSVIESRVSAGVDETLTVVKCGRARAKIRVPIDSVTAELPVVGGDVIDAGPVELRMACESAWVKGIFCPIGLNGVGRSALSWNDGKGERLYVGGTFTTVGCESVSSIASWDGSGWSPLLGPGGSGLEDGDVHALAVFDDGSGPALYVGGSFTSADGLDVHGIARWDGSRWSPLSGPGGTGVDGVVEALAVFDDGTGPALFAGGSFSSAGGVAVNRIARWDGAEWLALQGPSFAGMNGAVEALAVFDDGDGVELYVGGSFTVAGGVSVSRVARWDGNTWSACAGPSGVGVNGVVRAFTVFDDGQGEAIYAGGEFTVAGGVLVNRIARWDGGSWSGLIGPGGTGVNGPVTSLTTFDGDSKTPSLYAGGDFTIAGGLLVQRVAGWDGTTWSALTGPGGVGLDKAVETMTVFDCGEGPTLFVGGDFRTAGGVIVNRIAGWDGFGWSALAVGGSTGVSNEIFGFYGIVALEEFDDGQGNALYAGGDFTGAGGAAMEWIARWDGDGWSPLVGADEIGLNGKVNAIQAFDDGSSAALYAAGFFTGAGDAVANRIARWDGLGWSPLAGPSGTGLNDTVHALAVYDDGYGPALYAGGDFTTAGGVTVNRIARWDGAGWSPLAGPGGVGVNDSVFTLAVFDDGSGSALYAGGNFTTAGGALVNRVARWNGQQWSPLTGPEGIGLDGSARAMAVFDDGSGPALYLGGEFTTAGQEITHGIARWTGDGWSPLVGSSGTGVGGILPIVMALEVFNSGEDSIFNGGALYVGGFFATAGGTQVEAIARWDGRYWSALAGPDAVGVDGGVRALSVFDDGGGPALFAAGFFQHAGGVPSEKLAKWRGCTVTPEPCVGDLDGNGVVDTDDLGELLGAFGASDAGDLNGDGVTDTVDLGILLGAFGSVCE